MLSPKGTHYTTTPPPTAQSSLGEEEPEREQELAAIEDRKELVSSGHCSAAAHVKSQWLRQHTQDLCKSKPEQEHGEKS